MDPKPVADDAGAQRTIREAHDRRVPDELVRQLHEANGRADQLRRQLEAAAGDDDFGHVGRVEKVGEALREAERQIEEVSRRIREAAPPEAKGPA